MFPGSRQPFENDSLSVMAGLRPGHPRLSCFGAVKTWMPGTRPGMTSQTANPNFVGRFFGQTLRMAAGDGKAQQ
jgi:hypothetical protein